MTDDVKDCEECDGKGYVDCSHCGAEQMEECNTCEGSGEVEVEEDD